MRQANHYNPGMAAVQKPETPVSRVVSRFGGPTAFAEILGISRQAVWQWDEAVPHKHHVRLMTVAAERGIPLEHWELTMLPDTARSIGLTGSEAA